ncbi:hypothetical protein [Nocardiopsis aegyptia]|uniref:Uncharacterized protein n=1 Tax=Nocardiopsis aegyptia TaxID=220378 RepID=A0A7Z0EL92_9ACTN|nr:hypothetical protein [Nocardiopsis aegyptia]NYJ34177.1 hypothetical protein [Nocardiopsis aegyptia]
MRTSPSTEYSPHAHPADRHDQRSRLTRRGQGARHGQRTAG